MREWSRQTIGAVVSWMCYNHQDTRTDTRVWIRRLGRRGREYAGMRNSARVYFSVGSRASRTPTGARCATACARRLLARKWLMLGRMGERLESVAGTDRKTVATQCEPGRAVAV
jgi:hypothetical protein